MTSYHDKQTILKHNNTMIANMHNSNKRDDNNNNDCCTNDHTLTTKCSIQISKQRSDDVSKGCIICTESYHKNQIVLQLHVCNNIHSMKNVYYNGYVNITRVRIVDMYYHQNQIQLVVIVNKHQR